MNDAILAGIFVIIGSVITISPWLYEELKKWHYKGLSFKSLAANRILRQENARKSKRSPNLPFVRARKPRRLRREKRSSAS